MNKKNLSTNFLSFFHNGSLKVLFNEEPSVDFIADKDTVTINVIDLPIKISKNKGIIKKLSEGKDLAKSLKENGITLQVQLKGKTVLKLGKDANPKLAKIVTLSSHIEISDVKKLKTLSDLF